MADKRTRIDDLIRLGELRAAGSAPYSERIRRAANQFLEDTGNSAGYFGEPAASTSKRAGRRAAKFRQEDILTRDIKRGETAGLWDLLTFLPAASASKSLLAREFLPAGVNALAFTSQFGDDPVSDAANTLTAFSPSLSGLKGLSSAAKKAEVTRRLGRDWTIGALADAGTQAARIATGSSENSEGDQQAAYPMFGMKNIGGALRSARRAAELGKQPPIFNMAEGRIAPARMKLIEKGLREHIAMSGSKDPEGQLRKLDEWIERNPFWGKYPLHKRELFDTFPQDISGSLDQTLKDLGYGGVTQAPRDLSLLVDKRVNRPGIPDRSSTLTRTWEEKKPFEQKALAGEPSGILKGWMERNPGKTPPIFTRPGEITPPGWRNLLDEGEKAIGAGQQIDPRAKAFLDQLAIGGGIGAAANLATGGVATGDDNLAVVPGWKKLLRKDSLDEASRRLAARKRVEFMPSDIYERAKPDLSKLPGDNGFVNLFTGTEHFYGRPKGGAYELLVNGWPKSGLSVTKPLNDWFDDIKSGKLKVDAAQRANLPAIVKYSEDVHNYDRLRKDVDRRAELARQSRASKAWGAEGPEYPFPAFDDFPRYPELGDTKLPPSPADISAASRILGAQFPQFDKVGGFRVSGIRKGPAGKAREGAGLETSVPLRKPSSEENRIKTLADSRRWLHELISNRGSKPAAMTVGGAAAKNPTADYQKIFDYLGDPEDFFRKSRGNLGGLGIGAAGAGAAALDSFVYGENPQDGGDNRAGLVVNRRNLGRLAQLQAAAHERLERIRPAFPEMNYLESVFAAKYPKIYEKSVLASPKNAFNVGLGGASSGSFSPFTSRVTVGIPTSADDWAKSSAIPSIFNTMGHEALHGVDYRRLGKVNHPITGRRLDVGDFVAPIALEYKWAKPELTETLSKIYPDAAAKVANIKPKYAFPGTESDNPFTRLVKDIKYRTSPIEIRARKAGRTSEKTLSNLMDKLISLEE